MPRGRASASQVSGWRRALRLRLKRQRLLWRSFRSRHDLKPVTKRTGSLSADTLLVVSVVRNEMTRLPYFLEYYRALGVGHFLIVDNASDDGTTEFLGGQPDVSLWHTEASYRAARFGLDWQSWLLMHYGHQRWCLTVDADELLVYDGMDRQGLPQLAQFLDARGLGGLGTLMLELYPKGSVAGSSYTPGQDPLDALNWYDATGYRSQRQFPMQNLWVQGGMRERVFFSQHPERSPTLNKIPFLKWNRRFAYVNSTHSALPARLNHVYDGPGEERPAGVLLHTKFLPEIVSKSATEKRRGEHFHTPRDFDDYYDRLTGGPDLWFENSVKYEGADGLVARGLMPSLNWSVGQK